MSLPLPRIHPLGWLTNDERAHPVGDAFEPSQCGLHFENKAGGFLAILEYLGGQVRQRCVAAENMAGTAVDRLTGLLDAYFGMGFELFSKSEHMPELEETFSRLARARITDLNREYAGRLARFSRSLGKAGETEGSRQGLRVEQIARILMGAAEGA